MFIFYRVLHTMHESENKYLMLFNMLSVPLGFGDPRLELPEFFCNTTTRGDYIYLLFKMIICKEITQFEFCSLNMHIYFWPEQWKRCTKRTELSLFHFLNAHVLPTCDLRLTDDSGRTEKKELRITPSFPFLLCHCFQLRLLANTGEQ